MRTPKPDLTTANTPLGASFRDPAGFVFSTTDGTILRQINQAGKADYDLLMSSGLYDELVETHELVTHRRIDHKKAPAPGVAYVIEPQRVPFISYPFEWSFSQLRDAALLTLSIQKKALAHDMSLKDATAYNVQFLRGKPVFIDTLSFEAYRTGTAWQAYRQFCQHFLAPLALMTHTDVSLSQLLRVHLDGIPLDLASRLLPRRAKVRPGIAMHIALHGKAQKAKEAEHKQQTRPVSEMGLAAILDSLVRTIRRLTPPDATTEWGDYYDKTNYTPEAADAKARLLAKLVKPLNAATAIDIGGNNGRYSRVLNDLDIVTVCTDIDPNAVEANYRFAKHHKETRMLPLLVDITNPGGALGWANKERERVQTRLACDVVVALAVVHHLAISHNLPFSNIARYLATLGRHLVIEFVPKGDSQVNKLLSTRKDIFPEYTEAGLEKAFSEYYTLIQKQPIAGTKRTLYVYEVK